MTTQLFWVTFDAADNPAVHRLPPPRGSDACRLLVCGPGLVAPPAGPLTPDEFAAWSARLERLGYAVSVSRIAAMP